MNTELLVWNNCFCKSGAKDVRALISGGLMGGRSSLVKDGEDLLSYMGIYRFPENFRSFWKPMTGNLLGGNPRL